MADNFAEREPEIAAQIEAATMPRKNLIAAIRYLAGAVENGENDTMR
jgi:hypothetical protein